MTINCENCPLRPLELFDDISKEEEQFMLRFKTGELNAQPGTQILTEGRASAHLYTALKGMGLRYKTLEDGRRQVVGFILPGDFIGLQSGVMEEMQHSVEASTYMTLCVFNRSSLWDLFKTQPRRAFDLTHASAIEESLLGEMLSAVGQLDGMAKVSWVLNRFYKRLTALDLNHNDRVTLPYRQQDLADAMGLSLVHTNKTLAKLRQDSIASWADGVLDVHNPDQLAQRAHSVGERLLKRPLI